MLNAALISARWVSAWGKFPCLLSGAADLLGIQAYVVGAGEHLLERQPRLVEAPGAGERLDLTERARRESAFRAAHPSGLARGLCR